MPRTRATRTLLISLLLVLTALSAVAQEDGQPTTAIRAIWDPNSFVLINTSEQGVNLTNLRLVSERGEIGPGDWTLLTDETGAYYSLTDVRPGSCLVVYVAGGVDQTPPGADCTRIVAFTRAQGVNTQVWDLAQGGFTPFVGDTQGAACSVTEGTSCDITVASGGPDFRAPEQSPRSVPVRAIWTRDVFVLINISSSGADFSGLDLVSDAGAVRADTWVMGTDADGMSYNLANLRPGTCLVTYLSNAPTTALPEGVRCTRTASLTTLENPDDQVWQAAIFSALVNGETAAECPTDSGTTCDFDLPNADLAAIEAFGSNPRVDTNDPSQAARAFIRAVWTPETLVLINTTPFGLDLAELTLSSSAGDVGPELWVMNVDPASGTPYNLADFRPGSCLVATYPNMPDAPLPASVRCTRVYARVSLENLNDVVWSLDAGSFTASGVTCSTTEGTSCDITANTAD